jgi:hypothetical protein
MNRLAINQLCWSIRSVFEQKSLFESSPLLTLRVRILQAGGLDLYRRCVRQFRVAFTCGNEPLSGDGRYVKRVPDHRASCPFRESTLVMALFAAGMSRQQFPLEITDRLPS